MNHVHAKHRPIACLLLALLPSACSSSPPEEEPPVDQLTVGRVQGEIKVGMSAAAVVEVLGSPNIITTDELRRENWVYDKISTEHTSASTSTYGTLILMGGSSGKSKSSTHQRTLTIIIKFDENKLVRDFAYNYTQF
jgi:outer membrane protein assembly factor BamE (lipoprotein component of BamABCDE complex)